MFQTKVVEKVKTHVLCLVTFSENCGLCDNVANYGRVGQATYDDRAHPLCLPDT